MFALPTQKFPTVETTAGSHFTTKIKGFRLPFSFQQRPSAIYVQSRGGIRDRFASPKEAKGAEPAPRTGRNVWPSGASGSDRVPPPTDRMCRTSASTTATSETRRPPRSHQFSQPRRFATLQYSATEADRKLFHAVTVSSFTAGRLLFLVFFPPHWNGNKTGEYGFLTVAF